MDRLIFRLAATAICLFVLTPLSSLNVHAFSPDAERLFLDAKTAFEKGDFEHSIKTALQAERLIRESGNSRQRLGLLKLLGAAYLQTGHLQEAEGHLTRALGIAQALKDDSEKVLAANSLGSLYLNRGMTEEAAVQFNQALAGAKGELQMYPPLHPSQEGTLPQLVPLVLNNIGTLQALKKEYEAAAASYKEAIALSREYHQPGVLADALINLGKIRTIAKDPGDAGRLLSEAYEITKSMEETHGTAWRLISIGSTAFSGIAGNTPTTLETKKLSVAALQHALRLAERLRDHRSVTYASGYLGGVSEHDRDFEQALRQTRRAVLEAEQSGQAVALYLWQWQTGRILRELGRPLEAAAAYRRAIQTMGMIRDELSAGCFVCGPDFFREKVEPVYFGLADLLLELSGQTEHQGESTAYLLEARRTIEAMKGAELHDYFRDPCVDAYIAKAQSLEKVEDTAAVLYVIPLQKRLELLLSISSGIRRFTVAVGRADFAEEVKAFRRALEKRTTREYMPHSQKLYSWLITPLYDTLVAAHIETIVFVPDQWLRTVPLAALHDGRDFLVSRFAVASTQGLTLTDPKPLKQQSIDVLTAGITESVQGYPALQNVSDELHDIGGLYPGKLLKDSSFVTAGLRKELEDVPFSIVHIASHGEFAGDVQKSFLLAWDERISMDQLEEFIKSGKYRKVPLELLTLSACQTASGDDKAALGLAGVAVKAGARSAIATLWSVSDEASYQLVVEFYRQFRGHSITKAKALQQAQTSMLKHAQYRHPYYWAPFILIGNWL